VLAVVCGAVSGFAVLTELSAEPAGNLELSVGGATLYDLDVDHLNVTFSHARVFGNDNGWTEAAVNDTPVDLTELDGASVATVANLSLEQGTYTKVELAVEKVEALIDGQDVPVFVPSGKLKLMGNFVVEAGGTALFDIDIHLVKRGNDGGYNLIPVISKRGGGSNGGHGSNAGMPKGHISLALGKSSDSIDDFDHLNVTFDRVRIFTACNNSTEGNWTERALDNVTVDLTNLTATNTSILENLSLAAGNYSKIELHVSEVVGIVDGVAVDVKVPSGKLKIVGEFAVKANETNAFTFDIKVVQKGHKAEYNLIPVIAKMGDGDDDDE
jgi:hypothetical protein